jgi:hypothetical protein
MTERRAPNGTGTTGTTGTGLNTKGYYGPTGYRTAGTGGTGDHASGTVVPVVPIGPDTAGPEKLSEIRVVPVAPVVPPHWRRHGVGERVAAALGVVFAPASVAVDEDARAAFEERAAIAEHDGGLSRDDAETMAAREQGYETGDALLAAVVVGWAQKIDQLIGRRPADPAIAQALDQASAFIREGWALQAVRLGWGELELFGVLLPASLGQRSRIGAAFGGAVQAVTTGEVVRAGGFRTCRVAADPNSWAPIWDVMTCER